MRIILETQRLYLRELNPGDAEEFYALNADPEVIRYTGDEPFENTQAAKQFLQNYNHYHNYGFGRWAVLSKHDHTFLGWCGLRYTENKQEVDVGYRFFKNYWGLGYATEAVMACIDLGFREYKLPFIVGRVMAQNLASVRVLQKAGMTLKQVNDFEGEEGYLYVIFHPGNA